MSTLFSDSIAALNASKVSNIKRDSTAAKYGEPYASKKSATDAISKQLTVVTNEYNIAKSAVDNNITQSNEAQKNIDQYTNELNQINNDITSTESTIARNNARLKELENDMSDSAIAERNKLLNENGVLGNKLSDLNTRKITATNNLNTWKDKLTKLQQEKVNLDLNLSNAEKKKDQYNQMLDDAIKAEDASLKSMADANPKTVGADPDVSTLLGGYTPIDTAAIEKAKQDALAQQQRAAAAASALKAQQQASKQQSYSNVQNTYISDIMNQQTTFNNINNSGSMNGGATINTLHGENDPYDFGDGPTKGYVRWDAPQSGYGMTGRIDDIIAGHIQPKQKHAFMGEFPSGLTHLDWMIKTMDRPKIDVESIEQVRNNVKRNYPIKYNFGDLSITFWDDVYHKTITTIDAYFHGQVWQQPDPKQMGRMMLRDETVIPIFHIYDLVTDNQSQNVLKYTFYNATLASYDFDANDTDDEGTHVIQAVFKIEGYSISIGDSPPTLNPSNNPMWW